MSFIEQYQWFIIVGLSAIFSVVAVSYYYRKDRIEPEPLTQILKAFFLGIASTGVAFGLSWLALQWLLRSELDNNTVSLLSATAIAPVVEEFSKGVMVIYLARGRSFDGPLDGMVYGGAVGSGFAFAENILYGVIFTLDEGITVGLGVTTIRGVLQIIGHPLYTSLMGAGIGMWKVRLGNSPFNKYWRSVFLHMIWNLSSIVFLPGVFIGGYYGYRMLRKELSIAQQLDYRAYLGGYYYRKKLFLENEQRRKGEL